MTHASVLIADDDERILKTFARNLRQLGYHVFTAAGGEEAVAVYDRQRPDAAVVDIRMPGTDGLAVLRAIREWDPEAEVILMTGHGEKEEVIEALRIGASDFLTKPIDHVTLKAALQRLQERIRLKQELSTAQTALRESEARYRAISDLILDYAYAFRVESDGRLIRDWTTGAFARITGYTPEEADEVGGWSALIHPDDLPRAQGRIRRLVSGQPDVSEFRIVTKDGDVRWLRDFGRSVWDDAQGRVVRIIGAAQDITAQVQAEEELRAYQDQLQNLVNERTLELQERTHELGERVKELNCMYSISRLVERPNISLETLFREVANLLPPAWQYPEITSARITLEDQAFETDQFEETDWCQVADIRVHGQTSGAVQVCYRASRPDMDIGPFLSQEQDLIEAIAEHLSRVVERMQTKEALREERDRAQRYLDIAGVIILVIDADQTVSLLNRRGCQVLGCGETQVVGKNWFDHFIPERHREQVRNIFEQLMTGEIEAVEYFENPIVRRDGEERMIAWYNTILKDGDGHIVGTLSSGEDITLRERTESALRESEELFRQLAENIRDVFFVRDVQQNRMLYVSPAFKQIWGLPQERIYRDPRAFIQAVHPDDRQNVIEGLSRQNQGEFFNQEYRILRPDGAVRWIWARAFPIYDDETGQVYRVAGIAEDVTERKRMEGQLREYADHLEQMVEEKVRELEEERAKVIQAARLMALGGLATNVAHELNQPLAAMLFEADYLKSLARQQQEHASPAARAVWDELYQVGDNLAADVTRCRRITDYLRAFKRFSREYTTQVDLNSVIRNSLTLIENRLDQQGIVVQLRLTPGLSPILADSNGLEQVFLNLIGNAEDAVKEMGRRIEKGQVERTNYRKEIRISTVIEGKKVVATVWDNGCGIAMIDQARIFEPFFTTKGMQEGLGVGLSTSYGIVNEYGGEITFESAENEGTTFTLRFPAVEPGEGNGLSSR